MMRLPVLLCFLFLFPAESGAHVKWFVDNAITTEKNVFQLDTITFLLIFGALLYVGFAAYIEYRGKSNAMIYSFLHKSILKINELKLLKAGMIILFLGNIIESHYIAPNLEVNNKFFLIEQLLQAVLIILVVFFEVTFCIALITVACSLFFIFGFSSSVDYFFELVGISIALYFFWKYEKLESQKNKCGNQDPKYHVLGIEILRISLGLQLCALAIQDKIINSALSLKFLNEYPYFNVINFIGIEDFTDIHFVLAAGLAEFCMGLLLICNFALRIGACTALFFFAITSIILGPSELIGHIPIIIVLVIIINRPSKSFLTSWDARLFFPWKFRLNNS